MHDATQAGATAFKDLLEQLRAKGDADLGAYWAARPESDCEDARDYRALGAMVLTGVDCHLTHQDAGHREGFLRALTELLCRVMDGGIPCGDWDPLNNTAAAFADGNAVHA